MIPAAAPRLVPPGSTPRDAGLSTHPGLGLAVCWRSCSPGQAEGILMERLKIAARTAVRQPRPDREIHPLGYPSNRSTAGQRLVSVPATRRSVGSWEGADLPPRGSRLKRLTCAFSGINGASLTTLESTSSAGPRPTNSG